MAKTVATLITFFISFFILYSFVYKPNADEINSKLENVWFSKSIDKKTENNPASNKSSHKKESSTSKNSTVIDTYKGVNIYYNGAVRNVYGRNVTKDGYNLGLRYQCVEFVKRFYYEVYNHKMPESYGHAKEFFNDLLGDGAFNKARGMNQFRNGTNTEPQVDDLLVFGAAPHNRFGHVAIICQVGDDFVEIAQQNPGEGNPSKAKYRLIRGQSSYTIEGSYISGWLRL